MHNLPVDFSTCISTLFPHMHLQYCLLYRLMLNRAFSFTHTCTQSCLYTDAHKHICKQAHGAFGLCWELPVYLIKNTWLEAKVMQTRKGKNKHKNETVLSQNPMQEKHFPMRGKGRKRGGEKLS